MRKRALDYMVDRIYDLAYDIYAEMRVCEQISDYKLLIVLQDGTRVIFDGYHECFCKCDEDGYAPITADDEGNIFSSNLVSMMKEQELTPVLLAYMLNVNIDKAYEYIEGTRLPTYMMLRRLARKLRCSITDLTNKY